MKIDLNQYSFCFSVSLWRQFVMKRAFADRGLVYPKLRNPIQVSVATRANEPKAYSALALNFLELLFEAHAQVLPYIVIFEDDAYPCGNPQVELDAILATHPLPADCGILCLGDINGVSIYRGKQTLLLEDCTEPYTRLIPGIAENKGSHALVVFRDAYMPFAQAIINNGVTDLAISRISSFSSLHAYGLFFSPLFVQHNDNGYYSHWAALRPYRLPESYASRALCITERFPKMNNLTKIALSGASRFLVFSNSPDKDIACLRIQPDDVLVLLNRAVDDASLRKMPNRKVLIARGNADRKGEWFLPWGLEKSVFSMYDDVLLLSDNALAQERLWYRVYRNETDGSFPSTGWIAYKILNDDFPDSEVVLVDFNPGDDVGTYKWPKHAWNYEAEYYKTHRVKLLAISV